PKAAETQTATRVDCFGDPLPAGAVARMGTTRLRHADAVTHVLFAPDGKTVASGGRDDTVRLWDVATGKLVRSLQHPQGILMPRPVSFGPDGKTLLSTEQSGPRHLWLWDVRTGQQVREVNSKLEPDEPVYAQAVSSDGKTVASAVKDAVIQLWNAANGDRL